MASTLDMALDDIIERNKESVPRPGGRGRGRENTGRGPRRRRPLAVGPAAAAAASRPALGVRRGGPLRRSSFGVPKSFMNRRWRNDLFQDAVGSTIRSAGIETGTKLYISNLDYGVSNEDIKELYSEVGEIKRCGVHYDRNGRSKGTAEVVFSRQQDALAALKRYNNVVLDGKPMKIDLIGANVLPLFTRAVNGSGQIARNRRPGIGSRGRGTWPRRFRGRGRGRGRRQPAADREKKVPTLEQLDAELDKYHQEAMQT